MKTKSKKISKKKMKKKSTTTKFVAHRIERVFSRIVEFQGADYFESHFDPGDRDDDDLDDDGADGID